MADSTILPDMREKQFIDRLLLLIEVVAGGSRKEFAEMLGICSNNIAKWVSRGSFPSQQHLKRFRDKLGVNLNWFYTGVGPTFLYDRPEKYKRTDEFSIKVTETDYEIPEDSNVRFRIEEQKYIHTLLGILREKDEGLKKLIKSNLDTMKNIQSENRD